MLDELEQRIELCHQKGLEEEEIAIKASQASDVASDAQKGKRKGKAGGKTPGTCIFFYTRDVFCSCCFIVHCWKIDVVRKPMETNALLENVFLLCLKVKYKLYSTCTKLLS